MACSSSSSTRNQKNIVFINFHGKDCRKSFLSHLNDCLTDEGIKTFKDDTELERGKEIEPGLLEAIESSMISIVILTENYAWSAYCLDELVKILECREQGQMVVPIFLSVDPSDVANPTAGVYAEAFSSHRENVKVESWKAAMTQVANLSGFDGKSFSTEATLVKTIAADILKKLDEQTPFGNTQRYVGIDSQIETIKRLLSTDTPDPVRFIGIVGMGGIGKTTLAKVIYEQISCEFDNSSFVSVREILRSSGPVGLIERLLSELLRSKKIIMNTTFISNPRYARRLRHQKVLVVLDDVDGLLQWEDLVGGKGTSLFGLGSRIIVTSRDKQRLQNICDHIWEAEKLSRSSAIQLFCKHAFKPDCPIEEFKDVLGSILRYAGGNPLALKVLGSFLYGKSKSNWLSALDSIRKELHSDIHTILKISFDALQKNEQQIFLHIACFFEEGDHWSVMKNVLDSHGLYTESGLTALKDKCLLEDNTYGSGFRMHDLLREMGRQIVRDESGKRIIVDPEDMQQIVSKDSVSEAVEGIVLNMKDFTNDYCLHPNDFAKMPNLKFLKFSYFGYIYYHLQESAQFYKLQVPYGLEYLSDKLRVLHWELYPLKQLPEQFLPGNLVQLKMPFSKVEKLWEGTQNLQKLKELDLGSCSRLIELPDMSSASNIEFINLDDCESLVEIPMSWSRLDKLKILRLGNCMNIRSLPEKISFKSLENLQLKRMSELECFPDIECLDGLKEISITKCYNLRSIPSSIFKLKSLDKLDLKECLNLSAIREHAQSHNDFQWSSPRVINAQNCFSLGTLPDLEQVFTFNPRRYNRWERDEFYFTNCFAIEESIQSKMVALAKAKIQSMATYSYFQGEASTFLLICPGCEIPEWIKHKNMGNFITIQVPIHKRFIGFVVSAVLPKGAVSSDFQLHFKDAAGIKFDLETIKRENGDLLGIGNLGRPYVETLYTSLLSEHLFLTYTPFADYDIVVKKLVATDKFYEITFEMSAGEYMDVIECGVVPLYVVPLYAQSVNEKLETPQSETTQVTIHLFNNDFEVYVDKHQVENPDKLIILRTCQEERLEISEVEHKSTPSAHRGTLYYILGDERSRNVSILSWLCDESCLKRCPQELTGDSSDEDKSLEKIGRIKCLRETRKKCMEHDDFYFRNCFRADWSKIMVLAKMRIQAIAMCSYFQDKVYNFEMVYPGHEIPEWIKHQRTGNSITIQLPVNKRFLGIALSAVLSAGDAHYQYKLQFKNAVNSVVSIDWTPDINLCFSGFMDSHVILIYSSIPDYEYERLVKELGGVGDCYEVTCDFRVGISKQPVIKCGMVPLYVRIPKNEGLERPLEKLEIFVDGYRVTNSKQSIVLKTFKEADIKIPNVELNASTPRRDALNCIWGDEAHTNVGSSRQGEAQIKEFNQEPQGTEQTDEFLQRMSRIQASRFYECYINNGLLDWEHYPMKRLPAYIQPTNLIHLNLRFSKVKQLWEGKLDLKNLKIFDLSHSSIVKLPDLSLATNLEDMNLSFCESLVEIPVSMSHFNKLQSLNLRSCQNLTSIPSSLLGKSLKRLALCWCSKLECFPKIESLDALEELKMHHCDNLKSLPSSISSKSLKRLDLNWCSKLECFPKIECLDALEELYMSECHSLKFLPCSIWKLNSLSKFHLSGSSLENLLEIKEYSLSSAFQFEKLVIGRSDIEEFEYDNFNFSNCSKVNEVIGSQIVSLTKMRTQIVAVHRYFQNLEYRSMIVYPRCEIPGWIKHQNEGSSITIRLPVDKKFIGLALSVVLPAGWVCFDFELHFVNALGDCSFGGYRVNGEDILLESEHVFITTYIPDGRNSMYNEIVEKLRPVSENYEVTLVVSCRDGWDEDEKYIIEQDVTKCGIVPLYAKNKKELNEQPDGTNMVTIHRKNDNMLEPFVDGCRVERPNQEVIIQTCEEAGIEISDVEMFLEPPMPSKHLGTMYCVWGNETFGYVR